MHKKFYASGFIYHPSTNQILLQQNNIDPLRSEPKPPTSTTWSLIGVLYPEDEKPEASFKNIILELLGIKVKNVYPVYSYSNEGMDEFQYIVYSRLSKFQNFSPQNGLIFEWFSFKDVLKLRVAEQTKHDIVVGLRVIEAAKRRSMGEHTF